MFISIILPTRNRISLLTQALQAIRLQTHSNFEVLVLDDGSCADTRAFYPALFTEFGHQFRLMQVGSDGQRGQGPSASRNLGIQLAKGDVLAFCDDDDIFVDETHLAAVANLFAKHPEIDLSISNQRAVYADGSVREVWLGGLSAKLDPLNIIIDERFQSVTLRNLCRSGGFAHLNMICVRRQVVNAIGGFWEAVNYEEDRDFFWRCADASRSIAYTPITVAQHHVPDPALRVNVSSAIAQQERWLIAAMVSRHIALTVKSQPLARLCLHHEGDLLRRLALHCTQHQRPTAGFLLARQALGARFSFKWAAYCSWCWLKSLWKS
jgi:cellulose synthase/poly-beta-1,6-N-acetylglucosamine synthase-like glycosyltransferase